MIAPTHSPQEAQDRAVFMALMWAMSRPGEVRQVAVRDDPLASIGQALLDLETSFYTASPTLRHRFTRLGARLQPPDTAAYLFFSFVDEEALEVIAKASIGTLLFPDQAATIVVAAQPGKGPRLHLLGPGIKNVNEMQAGLPPRFWQLRNERVSFPLGWDVWLVFPPERSEEPMTLAAIPRSTLVEVI